MEEQPRVIIDPWTGDLYDAHQSNPFEHMPEANYKALLWGCLTDHPNIPLATETERVADCISGFSATNPGQVPGPAMREVYDAYYQCGGPGLGLPYIVSRLEAEAHVEEYFGA